MERANEVRIELEDMGSILAVMSRDMPYHVPGGYFDSNVSQVCNACGLAVSSQEMQHKAMPHAVPQGYFEGLAGSILATVAVEHTTFGATKEMPHSVPAGYFDALSEQVLNAVKTGNNAEGAKKKAKVIPFTPRFAQIRWAVAAALLVFITLGGYISFFTGEASGTESELATVSKEEIQDYLQRSYVMDLSRIVSTNDINQLEVDSKDIEQYLNETGWDVVD